jgi:hypothetical protein
MKIRNSPSGPFVTNSGGVPAELGPGAQLRLVDGVGTHGGTTVIPTVPAVIKNPTGADLSVALLLPNTGYQYGVHVKLDVLNPSTNVQAAEQLYIDASVDGGSSWTELAQNSHEVLPVVGNPGNARTISLDMPLALGTAYGVTSSPVSPSLSFRARIGATTGGGTVLIDSPNGPGAAAQNGTIYLSATENF